jgi:5'-nucleotidase/UDP-sugar diphosphatase
MKSPVRWTVRGLAAVLTLSIVLPASAQLALNNRQTMTRPTAFAGPGISAARMQPQLVNLGDDRFRIQPQSRATEFLLTVLHNNDGESQLLGLQDPNYGGIARFKTLVDQEKANALVDPGDGIPRGVVLVTSGDNFLAGPEFSASLEDGVPFYDSLALDQIGYDAMCIGNHEFDFGPDVLADFINSFPTPPPFLSCNLDVSAEPNLQALATSGVITGSVVVNANGYDIGIVGATTPNLPFISSPRDVVVDPNVAARIQAEIDAFPPTVNKVILISHLQSISEDMALLPMLTGVDIAVAGGGDELLANGGDPLIPGDGPPYGPYPIMSGGIPVVTTSGNYGYLGRLIVGFDSAGDVTEIGVDSGPVRVAGLSQPDGVAEDAGVLASTVNPVLGHVAALANNVIAQSAVDVDGVRARIRTEETNEGNLCADALLWQATMLADQLGAARPDVALQNGGGVRNDSVIPAGDFTELDTFDILPFSNFTCVVENIPATQFEEIMENAVSLVEFSSGRFAQIAGFRMTYSASGTPQELDDDGNVTVAGTRVQEIVLNDGTYIVRDGLVVPGAPSVSIATIDFLARGGDQYPYRGAPFTVLGVSYQQALFNYITNFLQGSIDAVDYRAGGEGRIIELP